MTTQTIRFFHRGAVVEVGGVHPTRTVLDWLREDARCTGTKEGCNEGDCGACTVVIGELPEHSGAPPQQTVRGLALRTVNACIQFLPTLHGKALFTVEDLKTADAPPKAGALHPAQQALVECHGSQCGFCTPGFVMSLWSAYEHHSACGTQPTRQELADELSGNLCRCTGYRPILDAAQTMHHWPDVPLDESGLLQQLKLLAQDGWAPVADSASNFYATPTTLSELLRLRAAHPQALIAAGTTDVGLWVTKQHRRFGQIIDVTRVTELRRIERGAHSLSIGAAASLTEAFDALAESRPQLKPFFDRFAGLPVRESGTLGGNVANGSPIGDSMPLLIALGATLVLASTRGERTLPIEDFYLAYRKTALAPDEVLARIEVPQPTPHEWLRADKISKRFEDDISAVCLAVALQVENGVIHSVRIGAGGVAAVPARATKTEAALAGQQCAEAIFDAAATVLEAEFKPLSDMRASSAYRRAVLGNLLRRGWQQSQPGALALADLTMEPLP